MRSTGMAAPSGCVLGVADSFAPAQSLVRSRVRRSVALVGTYPPTECGLATFTANVRSAMVEDQSGWRVEVLRVVDAPESSSFSEEVGQWVVGDTGSLARSVAMLNTFDVVVLQHEYGLFGGPDGEDVLEFIEALDVPLITVLHTVLLEPSPHQRDILDRIMNSTSVVVVQSDSARRRLIEVHGTQDVVIVPHGAALNFFGPALEAVPKPAMLTWGLLGPGKGIEHGIRAMAELKARSVAASYIIAGHTHPKVQATHGDRYRESLQELARSLGVQDRIRFDNVYRDWDSLRSLVRQADAVLLPYDSRDQVCSGVLVEAVASGKPVVATKFPHAIELLGDGAGILVDQGDVAAMADAIEDVLCTHGVARQMSAAARRAAWPLAWPEVGASYCALVDQVTSIRSVV